MTKVEQLFVEDIFDIFNKKDSNTIFIDVREPSEWEEGVIPGALKISLGDIPEKYNELDKSKNYVLVCRSGGRSNRAAHFLLENGFEKVTNFQGGMLDWYDNDYPVEK
jgi:rhodanese-related sulfurtransferase